MEFRKGILDFSCHDLPVDDRSGFLLQLPLAGSAIVPAYHISSLDSNQTLILDGETLAMIFMGNISTWDDPNIQQLNPNITLPHANITIGVTPGQVWEQTDVFKRALSLFSDDFARELANAGDDLGMMRPAMEGRAVMVSGDAERLQFVEVRSMDVCPAMNGMHGDKHLLIHDPFCFTANR